MKDHLLQIRKAIEFYSKSYENVILIGDFNVEISDSHMDYGLLVLFIILKV